MPRRQTRRQSKVGGGTFSMYCPLCNLPFHGPYEKHLSVLASKSKWLEQGLGFDDKTESIMEVGPDDNYGRFPIKGSGDDFCGNKYISGDVPGCKALGVVCHNDCIKYIEKTMKTYYRQNNSYKFTYDEFLKMWKANGGYPSPDKYMGQDYLWEQAHSEMGSSYFDSPLSEKAHVNSKKKIDIYIKKWVHPNSGGSRQRKRYSTRRTKKY